MKNKKLIILLLIITSLILSCSTTVKGKNYKDDKAMMYGMVYDLMSLLYLRMHSAQELVIKIEEKAQYQAMEW